MVDRYAPGDRHRVFTAELRLAVMSGGGFMSPSPVTPLAMGGLASLPANVSPAFASAPLLSVWRCADIRAFRLRPGLTH